MSCERSRPRMDPVGRRSAISAVILPSPQPTSSTRSSPRSVSWARLRSANHFCSDETSSYSRACHSDSTLIAAPCVLLPLRRARVHVVGEIRRSLAAGAGRIHGLGQSRAILSSSRQTVKHGPPLECPVGPEHDPPVELHAPDVRPRHLAAASLPAAPRLVLS